MSADAPLILTERLGGVIRLTLNRPSARNALSLALIEALDDALASIAEDRAARAVILAGAGPTFCAGHDLRQMRADPSHEAASRLFTRCGEMMTRLARLPQPTIAQVRGVATAAGLQLVASCDLAIAEAGARFATPGMKIGLFCATPMVALTRVIAPRHAMEMLLTGDLYDADYALRVGLINRVTAPEVLAEEALAWATQLAGLSARAARTGKAAYHAQRGLDLEAAYARCGAVMAEGMMSAEAIEGIDAFLQKRPPRWA
ncbi:enoyl-CoA hydratase [Myxococcota bacterium]|nr:enoyl-CoA hydratase [Myxococcota bacterium]MBU1431816.1 enoyl-CoA hydratase [Myxococcota bacterium]MBU1896269.1 enoyl-CoA hydratase [Myxococcota bacterium]